MKEAMYYKKLKNNVVQCQLCPKFCTIKENNWGNCNARKNIKGILYSVVYGKQCGIAIDPIEKKPLFHFYPGSKIFSIGTTGCNLHCKFCQNYTTAQAKADDTDINTDVEKNAGISTANKVIQKNEQKNEQKSEVNRLNELHFQKTTPEDIIKASSRTGCKSIAYTYNEPYINYEFVLETAKQAKKQGLKNVMVTNGFSNPEPAKRLYKYIDAANVDLKAFTEEFYKKQCDAKLEPVLDTIKLIKSIRVHLELTNLIIPTLNDDPEMIKKMCEWIITELGKDQIIHFSRFHPTYKMLNVPATPEKTLLKAREIAKKIGLRYVYIGNIITQDGETTFCPKCNYKLIIREGFHIIKNTLNDSNNGTCLKCNTKIKGEF